MRTTIVVTALLAVVLAVPAMGEEVTWTGAVDNDWKNPANWDRGRVPAQADDVTIPSGTPECRVPGNEFIDVTQLVNRGTISSSGSVDIRTRWVENHGVISAPDHVRLFAGLQNVNYGTITGWTVHMDGDEVGNAAGAVLSTSSTRPGGLIHLTGTSDVVNLGQIAGGDATQNGAHVVIECADGGITNEGTIKAGNGLSGGWGGRVVVEAERGNYLNKGTVQAGGGDGDAPGGKIVVEAGQFDNSDTVKAGDSPDGKGGSVEVEAGDFTSSVQISPGGGPLGVGELRIVCPTGELMNYGNLGRKTGKNEYVGNVYLAGHVVGLYHMPSSFINADTLVVIGRQRIAVHTLGSDGRILADNDNRFYVLPGSGVLDFSNVDTAGVNALGENYVFADSVVPPTIGYTLAFSPDPTMSGSDTTWVDASITGLWALDSAGGSDTLTVCITNLGTTPRVVNYDVTSARGWLVPLSGATASLYPLMSAYVKTTYAIPDTAATGSRDSMTAVLTINPGFVDTSLGEIYCSSGLLGIAEPEGPGLGSQVSSDRLGATIVRGVLILPPSSRSPSLSSILNVSGRKVLDLCPGTNDVSGLAPDVYFVRQAQAQAQAVSKVVIAE